MTKISFAFVLALTSSMMTAQVANDREVLDRIRVEGLQHSDVARVFETLTVDIGPRLTASPAHKRAVEFVRGELTAIGLSNVRVEPWKFGRGWSLEKLTIEMVEPRYLPLIGYGDAWSPPTAGEIIAMPVFAPVKTPDDVAAQKDRLKGAIFMSQPILTTFVRRDRPNPSDPQYEPNSAAYATSVGQRPAPPGAETPQQRTQRMNQAIHAAGVAVVLKPSIGEHGTVFVTGRDNRAIAFPSVTLSAEHYNMIAGMLERKIPVKLRVDLRSKFYDDDGNAYNVTAELPGTDPSLRDEVVMTIQDYGNYDVRTHHTNMDTIDRVDEKDIQQAAIVMATFAYNAANLDRKIPHKPR